MNPELTALLARLELRDDWTDERKAYEREMRVEIPNERTVVTALGGILVPFVTDLVSA